MKVSHLRGRPPVTIFLMFLLFQNLLKVFSFYYTIRFSHSYLQYHSILIKRPITSSFSVWNDRFCVRLTYCTDTHCVLYRTASPSSTCNDNNIITRFYQTLLNCNSFQRKLISSVFDGRSVVGITPPVKHQTTLGQFIESDCQDISIWTVFRNQTKRDLS